MDNAELAAVADDGLDTLTDRELLLLVARDMQSVRALAAQVAAQAGPMIESVSKNPMLKLLLK